MKSWVSLGMILMVLMTGCGRLPFMKQPQQEAASTLSLQQVEEVVQRAKENFATVERLQVQELYAQDVQEARDALMSAETYLQDNHTDQAYSAALKSLSASQRIIRKIYQDKVTPSAQKAQAMIQEIIEKDPDNPLKDFLPELTDILNYADENVGGQRDLDLSKVLTDLETVAKISKATQTQVKKPLESDLSFAPGKYDLSEEAQQMLQTFADEIIVSRNEYSALFPNQTIIVILRVIGYADELDFRTPELQQILSEAAEDQVPEEFVARRQFLNQRLSEFRAQTIGEYIVQTITQKDFSILVDRELVGRGEKLPPDVSSPYPISDPRRRICKIYGYVFGE